MDSSEYDNTHVYDEISTRRAKEEKFNVMQMNACYGSPPEVLAKHDGDSNASMKNFKSNKKCVAALSLIVIVLLLGVASACSVFALEIIKLKSEIASIDRAPLQQSALDTISDRLDIVTQQKNASVDLLYQQLLQVYSQIQQLQNLTEEKLNSFELATSQMNASNILYQQLAPAFDTRIRQLQNSTATRLQNFENIIMQMNASIVLYQQMLQDYSAINTTQISQLQASTTERLQRLDNTVVQINASILQQMLHDYSAINTRISQLQNLTAERLRRLENTAVQMNAFDMELLQKYLVINATIQLLQNSTTNGLENLEDVTLQISALIDARNSAFDSRIEDLINSSDISYHQLSETISALMLILSTIGGQSFPVHSCASLSPSSPSGYYWVRTSNDSAVRVYCDMTRSCGGVTGGWTRVAELDMTNSSHQCPNGLMQRSDSNIRTCVRNSYSAGCSSVMVSTSNINYSSVCGRVIAYQFATTDAFQPSSTFIDSVYVDGVSLTHGSPREHIWTFASALDEPATGGARVVCPCIIRNIFVDTIPSFVGNDYFCDTGSQNTYQQHTLYPADPLWDGAGCGPLNTCCSFNNPPWFYKLLPQPTTDDIEMRVCRDSDRDNEDIYISSIDIYVR